MHTYVCEQVVEFDYYYFFEWRDPFVIIIIEPNGMFIYSFITFFNIFIETKNNTFDWIPWNFPSIGVFSYSLKTITVLFFDDDIFPHGIFPNLTCSSWWSTCAYTRIYETLHRPIVNVCSCYFFVAASDSYIG